MIDDDVNELREALRRCWSLATSPEWLPENPARGQCNVTALVFYDCFGGEILKTQVGADWHFYNRIEGTVYDARALPGPRLLRRRSARQA